MPAPQPKYWLWKTSGAVMRSISPRSLTSRKVAKTPSVTPLCGSTSISGMGMKGAVAGFSQRAMPLGGFAGAGEATGAGGTSAACGSSCAAVPEAATSSPATAAAPAGAPVACVPRRRISIAASVRRVPAVRALEACGTARAGNVPGDGWNGRKRRAEGAAGVRIMLVREIVGEQCQLPGSRTTREGHAGICRPVGRLKVEIVDDVELDLVLPHVVGAHQQITGRGGDQVAATHVPLQTRCLVELVVHRGRPGRRPRGGRPPGASGPTRRRTIANQGRAQQHRCMIVARFPLLPQGCPEASSDWTLT